MACLIVGNNWNHRDLSNLPRIYRIRYHRPVLRYRMSTYDILRYQESRRELPTLPVHHATRIQRPLGPCHCQRQCHIVFTMIRSDTIHWSQAWTATCQPQNLNPGTRTSSWHGNLNATCGGGCGNRDSKSVTTKCSGSVTLLVKTPSRDTCEIAARTFENIFHAIVFGFRGRRTPEGILNPSLRW